MGTFQATAIPSRFFWLLVTAGLMLGWLLVPDAKPVKARPPSSVGPATQPAAGAWRSLFDGKSLKGWDVSDYAGHGEPRVEDGAIVLPFGELLTGVTYTGDVPKIDYEVELDAKRVDGADFFCGLTFPVKDSHASLILGGWGGAVCGISSLDGKDALRNETKTAQRFVANKWYHIRLRVLPDKLQAWIDNKKIVDVTTTGKKISTRPEVNPSKPFGIASYQTTAALRNIRIRTLEPHD